MKPSRRCFFFSLTTRPLSHAQIVEQTLRNLRQGRARLSNPGTSIEGLDGGVTGAVPVRVTVSTASPPAGTSRPRRPARRRCGAARTGRPALRRLGRRPAAPGTFGDPRARGDHPCGAGARRGLLGGDHVDPVAGTQQPHRRRVRDPHRRGHHLDGGAAARATGSADAGDPWPVRLSRGPRAPVAASAAAVTASPAASGSPAGARASRRSRCAPPRTRSGAKCGTSQVGGVGAGAGDRREGERMWRGRGRARRGRGVDETRDDGEDGAWTKDGTWDHHLP